MSRARFVLIVALIVAVTAAGRGLLLGRGALCGWDEVRYLILAESLGATEGPNGPAESSVERVISAATAGTLGRPGAFVFWAPAILVQRTVSERTGSDLFDPSTLVVPQAFSWFWSLVCLGLTAALAGRTAAGRYRGAILATLVYAALVNSNLYVRAINPFDPSLACFLFALWLALVSHVEARRAAVCGVLVGLGFLTYPGNFWLGFIVAFALWERSVTGDRRAVICSTLGGASALPALVEVVSSATEHSYSAVLKHLVPTVSRGDSRETLLFPFRYLLEVETALAPVLLLALAYALWLFLARSGRWSDPALRLVLLALLCMTAHGVCGTLFGAPVFYGRLLHCYMPLLVLSCVVLEGAEDSASVRPFLLGVVSAAIAFVGGMHVYELRGVEYPRDRYLELVAADPAWQNARRVHESEPCSPMTRIPSFNAVVFPRTEQTRPEHILVNFCDPYGFEEPFAPFETSAESSVRALFTAPHFINFPAYQFEGLSPPERKRVRERAPIMRALRGEKEGRGRFRVSGG